MWPNEAKVLDTHQPDYKINRDRQTIEDKDVLRCVNNYIKTHTWKQMEYTSQLLSGNWKHVAGFIMVYHMIVSLLYLRRGHRWSL